MKNRGTDPVSNIMSKSDVIFTENFAIFSLKAENMSEFKFDKF